jgi:DNA replication protein DnaC
MANKICPVCEGSGWILEEADGKQVARRCRCFHAARIEVLREQARIPRRYRNCSLDNFEVHNDSHRDALKISRQFVKNYPAQEVGLLYIGPCGVGKTHLAVAVLRELVEKKNVPCAFFDFRELIRDIQSTFTPESNVTESDVLSPVFETEILVLDELGAKRTTAWVEETVFYIINQRYNQKKLTIFTSNYLDTDDEEDRRDEIYKKKDDSLVSRIGFRLRSRIYEMCKVVEIWGEDYRKVAKQAGYRF